MLQSCLKVGWIKGSFLLCLIVSGVIVFLRGEAGEEEAFGEVGPDVVVLQTELVVT